MRHPMSIAARAPDLRLPYVSISGVRANAIMDSNIMPKSAHASCTPSAVVATPGGRQQLKSHVHPATAIALRVLSPAAQPRWQSRVISTLLRLITSDLTPTRVWHAESLRKASRRFRRNRQGRALRHEGFPRWLSSASRLGRGGNRPSRNGKPWQTGLSGEKDLEEKPLSLFPKRAKPSPKPTRPHPSGCNMPHVIATAQKKTERRQTAWATGFKLLGVCGASTGTFGESSARPSARFPKWAAISAPGLADDGGPGIHFGLFWADEKNPAHR